VSSDSKNIIDPYFILFSISFPKLNYDPVTLSPPMCYQMIL
jgi:hypothetical protein